jgi:hypothetical protein
MRCAGCRESISRFRDWRTGGIMTQDPFGAIAAGGKERHADPGADKHGEAPAGHRRVARSLRAVEPCDDRSDRQFRRLRDPSPRRSELRPTT